MRLLVPEKFLDESAEGEKLVEKNFDLERILARASFYMEFRPDENGFYLRNDDVQIRYTKEGGALCKDILDISFLSTRPEIELSGDRVWMPFLTMRADAIKCNTISIEDPRTRSSEHFFKERPFWDCYKEERIGKPEWYEEGKKILKQAAEKYSVSEAYGRFRWWGRRRALINFGSSVYRIATWPIRYFSNLSEKSAKRLP